MPSISSYVLQQYMAVTYADNLTGRIYLSWRYYIR